MTNTTPASRFRVEHSDSESVRAKGIGEWYVVRQRETDDEWLRVRNTRSEIEYLLHTGEWSTMNWHDDTKHGWYKTEAEARYRLLLYTDPREALAAFYDWLGEDEYVGDCNACWGRGMQGWTSIPCPACHGTGGPPSADTLMVAADWYEERGMTMEAEVLRTIAQGAKE